MLSSKGSIGLAFMLRFVVHLKPYIRQKVKIYFVLLHVVIQFLLDVSIFSPLNSLANLTEISCL